MVLLLAGCAGSHPTSAPTASIPASSSAPASAGTASASMAFFYPDVTPSSNVVRTGLTPDGRVVESTGGSVLTLADPAAASALAACLAR